MRALRAPDSPNLRFGSPLLPALCAYSMKALLKFSTIAILLVTLIGLILLLAVSHHFYSGKVSSVTFVNNSGQGIQLAEISVAGKSCNVKELGANGEFKCHFENLSDSSYSVSVRLQDGTVYSKKNLGYVTGGFSFQDTITISEAGVISLEPNAST